MMTRVYPVFEFPIKKIFFTPDNIIIILAAYVNDFYFISKMQFFQYMSSEINTFG